MTEKVTRRDFVRGAAVGGAAGLVAGVGGGVLVAPGKGSGEVKVKPNLPAKWHEQVDVLVVGAGGAGLAAGIEAAKAGAKTVILDKEAMIGGQTAVSAGSIDAAGTSVQKAAGIEDTPERWYEDLEDEILGHKLRPEIKRFVYDSSAELIDWLIELGVEFVPPEPAIPRWHIVAPGFYNAGRMVQILEAEAKKLGAEILTNHKALELYTDGDGRVAGIKVQPKSGEAINYKAGAVVLATSGFHANQEMVEKYTPLYAKAAIRRGSPLGCTGDGILMGKAIGAALEDMHAGATVSITAAMMLVTDPVILVNAQGERFMNELDSYVPAARNMLKLKLDHAFMIFDEKGVPQERLATKGGQFGQEDLSEAATIEELASKTGIDAKGLAETIERFNRDVDAGKDSEFGKEGVLLQKIEQPTFYAIKVQVNRYKSEGGLMINLQAQVLDHAQEQPIPGLYAAGQTCGSLHPELVDTLVMGRVAGKNAAAEAKGTKA